MPASVHERVGHSDNDYSLERTSSGSFPQSTGNTLDTQIIQSGSQIHTNGDTENSQEEPISTDEQSPRSECNMPPDCEADDEVRTPATSPATHGAEDNPQVQQTEPNLSDMLPNLSAEDLDQFNKYFESGPSQDE